MLKKIFGFFSKPHKKQATSDLDQQMAEIAAFFSGTFQANRDVLFADQLDRSKLDLSLESLHAVDNWLNVLHKNKTDPSSEKAAETIIWAGSYIGEVIRKNSNKNHTWMRHEEFMSSQTSSIKAMFPFTFGSQFLLIKGSGNGMTMPINKVCRYLAEGIEHNTHFYASAECSPS